MVQQHAEQACNACKRLKRGCDKSLPECRLCSRTGRRCDYSRAEGLPPTAAEFEALKARLATLEERLGTTIPTPVSSDHGAAPSVAHSMTNGNSKVENVSEFPVALFLDVDCFKWSKMRLPSPAVEIPIEVLAYLTHGSSVVETCEEYFRTIHTWWPVVSKKRIELGVALLHRGPELAMLFLAMQLIISNPDSEDSATLYRLSKEFLMILQDSGSVSYHSLQALLLLALYEYSHAIYPAAWMTIGACARYAEMLGISCSTRTHDWAATSGTWTEVEEKRRLWWGIFILDRLICLGSRRPSCLTEPLHDGLLPVDDQVWDDGDVMLAQNKPISTPPDKSSSPFTLLCWTANLVEASIRATGQAGSSPPNFDKLNDIADELLQFMTLVDECAKENVKNPLSWLAPRAVIRSSLFVTLDLLSCPEKMSLNPGFVTDGKGQSPEQRFMQKRALSIIQDIAEQSTAIATEMLAMKDKEGWSSPELTSHLAKISPLALDSMYCSLSTYYWLAGENGYESYQSKIQTFRDFFENIAQRWRLGREYLRLSSFYNVFTRSEMT